MFCCILCFFILFNYQTLVSLFVRRAHVRCTSYIIFKSLVLQIILIFKISHRWHRNVCSQLSTLNSQRTHAHIYIIFYFPSSSRLKIIPSQTNIQCTQLAVSFSPGVLLHPHMPSLQCFHNLFDHKIMPSFVQNHCMQR